MTRALLDKKLFKISFIIMKVKKVVCGVCDFFTRIYGFEGGKNHKALRCQSI